MSSSGQYTASALIRAVYAGEIDTPHITLCFEEVQASEGADNQGLFSLSCPRESECSLILLGLNAGECASSAIPHLPLHRTLEEH